MNKQTGHCPVGLCNGGFGCQHKPDMNKQTCTHENYTEQNGARLCLNCDTLVSDFNQPVPSQEEEQDWEASEIYRSLKLYFDAEQEDYQDCTRVIEAFIHSRDKEVREQMVRIKQKADEGLENKNIAHMAGALYDIRSLCNRIIDNKPEE